MNTPYRALFWNGPAHNQVWVVDSYSIKVSVPMEISINQVTEPSMEFSFETVEYLPYEFVWHWDGWPRTGVVMCSDFDDTKEVETVMAFLASLWGVQVCEDCGHAFTYHEQKGYCVKNKCVSCRMWRTK